MNELWLPWLVALAASILVERATRPISPILAATPMLLATRLIVLSLIFAIFLVLSWRPMFAAAGTIILVAVFVAISNGKLAYTYEPLVFSDVAFVRDIFRHATLFHTTFLGPAAVLGALGMVALIVALFFRLERPLPVAGADRLAAVAALVALLLSLLASPVRRRLARGVSRMRREPEVFRDIGEAGLIATLVTDALAWLGEDRSERISHWRPKPPAALVPAPRGASNLVVAVQCESFTDLRRLGATGLRLPNLDAARKRACAWGRLGSAFAGGYTMRTEVSFLTGRSHRDLGWDRYYPYLNAGAYGAHAIPALLRAGGCEAVFVHPFHRHFFQRHRAIPALGFSRMVMIEEFASAPLVGDYVSDDAVGRRVIEEAKRMTQRPAFLFAATMENHEPWCAGRFEGVSDPVAVYQRHVENGDALLGQLIAAFDDWPGRVALAFYGDHVPLLKAFADPFPESDTDYVLLELGREAQASGSAHEERLEVNDLAWRLLALAGWTAKAGGEAEEAKTKSS